MKPIHTLFFLLCLTAFSAVAVAQRTGDFRTHSPVNGAIWSSPNTWDRFNGSSWINPAPSVPSGGEVTVTIQSGDSVSVDVAVTITDSVVSYGKIGGGSDTLLTFANGSMYRHRSTNAIVRAKWQDGSTMYMNPDSIKVTSIGGGGQKFYNLVWNSPYQTSNTSLGMNGDTIRGNVTVLATGGGRFYLTTSGTFTTPIVILGNITVSGGAFSSNGSGSAGTVDPIVVKSYGNIRISKSANFGASRGSGPTVEWYMYGDSISVLDTATLQNSGTSSVQKFIFAKEGMQVLTLGSSIKYGGGSSAINMDVAAGTALDLGASVITNKNTGSFTLAVGATLATAHAEGLSGAIQSLGDYGGGNSLSTEANYIFHGSSAQVTSGLMPTTINNLDIDNTVGVTLSQATTINGVLRLKSGVFDNTIPFTLGPSGSISKEGGSLLITAVKETDANTIPQNFFVNQNYPNPFNPSTTITYGLPKEEVVTIGVYNLIGQEVVTLVEGKQGAGFHSVRFNAAGLNSGVYFYKIRAGNFQTVKRMVLLK